MTAFYVYEVLDRDNRLIYVGSTANVFERMDQHAVDSWWADQATHVTARVVGSSRHNAQIAERATIKSLHPRWNIHGLPPRRQWTADNYLDYVVAKAKRSAWDYTYSRAQLARMVREYRVRHGSDLMTDLMSRGDLPRMKVRSLFAQIRELPTTRNLRTVPA